MAVCWNIGQPAVLPHDRLSTSTRGWLIPRPPVTPTPRLPGCMSFPAYPDTLPRLQPGDYPVARSRRHHTRARRQRKTLRRWLRGLYDRALGAYGCSRGGRLAGALPLADGRPRPRPTFPQRAFGVELNLFVWGDARAYQRATIMRGALRYTMTCAERSEHC